MKGNANGNLVNKMVESQATRTKFANAVVCAKAVSDAKEAQLWKVAGDSVLELYQYSWPEGLYSHASQHSISE